MNFDLKKPCADCPFLRNSPVRLHPDRAEEITEIMLSPQGGMFACHKTTREGGASGAAQQHCAGALLFAINNDNATQMMRIAGRLGWDPDAMSGHDEIIDDAEGVTTDRERKNRVKKKKRARQLATIAKWINDNVDGLYASTEPGTCNTDRKVGRLRVRGKGRTGTKITVRRFDPGKNSVLVLEHNSAETYRTNGEVEEWLSAWLAGKCTMGFCYGPTHSERCRLAGQPK